MERRKEIFNAELENIFKDNLQLNNQYKKYNQYSIKHVIHLRLIKEDVDKFNQVINLIHLYKFNPIKRTGSGSISNNVGLKLNNFYSYDIRNSSSRISLTIIYGSNVYNIVVGKPKKEKDIAPITAWNKFIEICNSFKIDFNDYKISKDLGKKISADIKANISPIINMKYYMSETDKPLENVHHIDIHSSYPSGLVKMYPEFKEPIEYIYNKRKEDPIYKSIMNYTISGCTMSKYYPWYRQWAHIAKFVRENNNDNIRYLAWLLELNGREVIGYNTDGIWYRGEIFHKDKDKIIKEGPNVGEWSNDHTNCLFRSKSDGAYEFIENGKYEAVVRGLIALDNIEPDRNKWKWGDIYSSEIKEYYYDEKSELIKEIE